MSTTTEEVDGGGAGRSRVSLIAEIRQGALDEEVPLAATLRKCIALGGEAGSAELRDWALRELNGYEDSVDKLPEWRKVLAPLKIDLFRGGHLITGKDVSTFDLPEVARGKITNEVPVTAGVAQLESLVTDGADHVKIGHPLGQELVSLWNHQVRDPFQQIQRLYWAVSMTSIRGVLDRVRTTLTALVAEIKAGTGDDTTLPSPELARQALQIAVHGNGNRVIVNQSGDGDPVVGSTVGSGDDGGRSRWKFWGTVGAFIVGLVTIIGVIVQIMAG